MPAQVGQTGLLAQFKGKLGGVAKRVAEAPIEWGQEQDPPPGIRNGVAQVVECYYAEYKSGDNKGKPYFRAAAVIQEPHSVVVDGQEVACAGRQTSIMIPILPRKDKNGNVVPAEEALFDSVNEMRKMLHPHELDPKMVETEAGLYQVAKAISDQKPYIGFSTSKREPREYVDPKTKEKKMSRGGVWQNWHGARGLEEYVPSANGQSMDASGLGASEPTADPSNADGAMDDNGQAGENLVSFPPSEDVDLSALLAAAEAKDGEAQLKLKSLAEQHGMTAEEFDAGDWADVAAFVQVKMEEAAGGTTEEPAAEEAPPEPPPPAKGEVWSTVLSKPGAKKGVVVRRSVKVEVLTVNKKNETVTLQDTETKKPIMENGKPVVFKFSDLSPA